MPAVGRRMRRGSARHDRWSDRTQGNRAFSIGLAGYDRAMVTDIPGTTRDIVTEAIELKAFLRSRWRHRGRSATQADVRWSGKACASRPNRCRPDPDRRARRSRPAHPDDAGALSNGERLDVVAARDCREQVRSRSAAAVRTTLRSVPAMLELSAHRSRNRRAQGRNPRAPLSAGAIAPQRRRSSRTPGTWTC